MVTRGLSQSVNMEVVMDFVFFFAGLISVIVGIFIIKRTSPNKPHGHH